MYYQYGGIQLVVIDGIADLVKSANDEVESVAVIDELYRLAGIYNTCILCVLHIEPVHDTFHPCDKIIFIYIHKAV